MIGKKGFVEGIDKSLFANRVIAFAKLLKTELQSL